MSPALDLSARQTPRYKRAFFRFVAAGVLNTGLSYALYFALLAVLPYRLSYTIAFAFGILLAYVLNRYFVFGTSRRLLSVGLFPLVYLVQFLAGLAIVSFWVEVLAGPQELAPVLAVILTVPVTFLLTRFVFRGHEP